jgi:deoxyadenosine/deoxycytidine kinase
MKSLVFAAITLKGDEFNLYRQIFYIIYKSLPKPDIYVYLHIRPERLLANIAGRGRSYEKSITREYLQRIQDSYFTYFRQNPENRYLVIDASNLDFVNREDHFLRITDLIFGKEFSSGLNVVIL